MQESLNQLNMNLVEVFAINSSCTNPNIWQFTAIVALILGAGIGVVSVAGGISVMILANTIVSLIIAGAGTESIGAAIATQIGPVALATGTVAALYEGIKNILGC